MPADELGSVRTSDPVRVAQAVKHVEKELDREKKEKEHNSAELEREEDVVQLSNSGDEVVPQAIFVKENYSDENMDIPGGNIDVTVG